MQAIGVPPSEKPSASRSVPRALFWAAMVAVVAVLAFGAYLLIHPNPPSTPDVSTVPARNGAIIGAVSSTGQIATWNDARLSFRSSGRIATINVRVGDIVKKGDPIASLDTTDLKLQVEQAQAGLETAQAKLSQVQAGPRAQDVLAAQAVVDAAQAKLDGMLAGGRPENVQSAQAALASAKAKLHLLQAGSQPADIAAAQSAVDVAQGGVVKAQAALDALTRPMDPLAVQSAQLAVQQAQDAFWGAQTARDGICGATHGSPCGQANAQVSAAADALEQAKVKLAQVQEPPQASDVASAKAAVQSAQAQLTSAQARLAQLKAGPLPDDVAQASAAVDQADQALQLTSKPFSNSDIAQQRQVVAQAQAQLELKKSPYTDADVAAAKAAVDQAQAQLDLAKYNLASASIVAPFDGAVSAVNANVGDTVTATTGPVASIVDPNDLRLDVSVDETEVSRIQPGQDVQVNLDALPGQAVIGKVLAIAPNAAFQTGVATYTVTISVPSTKTIKPGMTADTSIVYAKHDSALIVPSRAIRNQGSQRVVGVLVGDKVESRPVTVGISDGNNTEILSGLKAGDAVVIPATAPSVAGSLAK